LGGIPSFRKPPYVNLGCLMSMFTTYSFHSCSCLLFGICVVLMFARQCQCLPAYICCSKFLNLLLIAAADSCCRTCFIRLKRYAVESHLTHIFPKDFVLFLTQRCIFLLCMREGLSLEIPLNLILATNHGRGTGTKARV
jgi:hypothetical protein